MRRSLKSRLHVAPLTRVGFVVCALSTVLIASPLLAKDPDSDSKDSKLGAATSKSDDLPECLQKLNLSSDQQSKARDIAKRYDKQINDTWEKFGEKYLKMIRTEVEFMSAFEDHLSEPQRSEIRRHRRHMAHGEAARHHADKKSDDKSDNKTESTKENATDAQKSDREKTSSNQGQQASVILFNNGIALTVEQEEISDRIHHRYAHRLRALNREIDGLHARLIALEADKISELEGVLTKDQLDQLHKDRQSQARDSSAFQSKSSTRTE